MINMILIVSQIRHAFAIFSSMQPGIPLLALHGRIKQVRIVFQVVWLELYYELKFIKNWFWYQAKRTHIYFDFLNRPHAVSQSGMLVICSLLLILTATIICMLRSCSLLMLLPEVLISQMLTGLYRQTAQRIEKCESYFLIGHNMSWSRSLCYMLFDH